MYNNYSNRVKNFIIDMINPDTQIIKILLFKRNLLYLKDIQMKKKE